MKKLWFAASCIRGNVPRPLPPLLVEQVLGTVTDPNTSFDNIIKFIAGWISKLGLVVGFIGAVQLGFAFKNDDADGKTKGLRTLISGFIVFALCSSTSLQMFGIV